MKIRLLDCNGYVGMGSVKFPVEVEAEVSGRSAYVPRHELHRIGATRGFHTLVAYCFSAESWEKAE